MTGLPLAAICFGALIFYLFVFERFCIRVRRYRIRVSHLPQAFAGFRIVQLSDLHYGALQPLISLRYVIWRANRIKRDITVCTGDYVLEKNGHQQIDRIWPLLACLHAPSGVYSILGNHDHWADTERSLQWMDRTGQNLRGRRIVLERGGQRLWLAGTGDLWEDPIPLDRILTGIPETDCRIVLAHNPDSADTPFSGRVDLMISGHTHGGQFVLPFVGPPFNPVKNKSYTSGRKRSRKGVPLFITTGIGWGTFPVRLNCYPEIAVLELWPARKE